MTRVCLIVDHPTRDLDGLVLLAAELAARGAEVFLVPMYQRYETLVLKPDLVLVNYLRQANVEFLRTCRTLGIRVGVLDTEGGVHQDTAAFADAMAGYVDAIDLYCVWGRRQFAVLEPYARRAGFELRGTGCPRYDFAVAPWCRAVADPAPGLKDFVLVNGNFPLVNPRFQSAARERRHLVASMGQNEALAVERLRQTGEAQRAMVTAVGHLAVQFAGTSFVMRPHPFEDKAPYLRWFAAHPNVQVRQEGTVFEWMGKASLLVHHNCSTAIEAFMMGREPVHLEYIGGELLRQPAPVAVSHRAGSLDEASRMVALAIAGDGMPAPDALLARRRKVVEDFFWANDGHAAVRVADAVLEAVGNGQSTGGGGSRGYPGRLLRAARGWRARLQQVFLLLLGGRVHDRVRRMVRPMALAGAKRFGALEVQAIMERLTRAEPRFLPVSIRPAQTGDAIVRLPGGLRACRVALGDPR